MSYEYDTQIHSHGKFRRFWGCRLPRAGVAADTHTVTGALAAREECG